MPSPYAEAITRARALMEALYEVEAGRACDVDVLLAADYLDIALQPVRDGIPDGWIRRTA